MMASRQTKGLERAYVLFANARGELSLSALNALLAPEGIDAVKDRMFVHLRRLFEDGVSDYIPANQHEQWRKTRRAVGESHEIDSGVQAALRDQNPWWRGEPAKRVPTFRRWLFPAVQRALVSGLAPAVSLRGPRRVGKTVLVRQLIDDLLQTGVRPQRILFVSFDDLQSFKGLKDPILALARWYESTIVGATFNQADIDGQPAYLFLDEVQNLRDWAPQLKSLVDNHAVRVLVTGSSSLRIEAGRDSLAGRITTIEMGPLLLREIASLRRGEAIAPYWTNGNLSALLNPEFWLGLAQDGRRRAGLRDDAFRHFSERGAYPFAHERSDATWEEVSTFLNESVIQRAIKHDLRVGDRGRKRNEDLLYELLKGCCRYAGQTVLPRKFAEQLAQVMGYSVSEQTVRDYLDFLDQTLLLRMIKPMEIRLRRPMSAERICLSDPSLRASWLGEAVPLDPGALGQHPELADIAGRLAESTAGYFLSGIPNLEVRWLPERGDDPEVDLVIAIGDRWIPLEVKYRARIDPVRDVQGLLRFLDQPYHRAPFGLLITREDIDVPIDPRIIPLPLSSLLWMK